MSSNELQRFRRLLDNFVFFHLGADAVVSVEADKQGVAVAVEHGRVHPFRWTLTFEDVIRLTADPHEFEDAMLDQLTRYRRT